MLAYSHIPRSGVALMQECIDESCRTCRLSKLFCPSVVHVDVDLHSLHTNCISGGFSIQARRLLPIASWLMMALAKPDELRLQPLHHDRLSTWPTRLLRQPPRPYFISVYRGTIAPNVARHCRVTGQEAPKKAKQDDD